MRLLLTPFPQEEFNQTEDQKSEDQGDLSRLPRQFSHQRRHPSASRRSASGRTFPARHREPSGSDFDLAYIRGQVTDHRMTAQLFEWEIGSGYDPMGDRFGLRSAAQSLCGTSRAQGAASPGAGVGNPDRARSVPS
jgi:hypothetical protein